MGKDKMKNQMVPNQSVTDSTVRKVVKKKAKSSALGWGGAVVGCLLAALIATNLAAPAFAEKMPLVGGIFAAINNRNDKYDEPYVTFKTQEYAEGVNLIASENDPIHLILSEAYCDGMRIGFSLAADAPAEWGDVGYANLHIKSCTINGEDCLDYDMLPRFVLEDGKFIGSGSITLYNTFDISNLPDFADVKISFENFIPADDGSRFFTADYEESLAIGGTWSYSFKIKCNADDLKILTPAAEDNGWRFDSVISGSAETLIYVTSPAGATLEDDIVLRGLKDKDGNAIEWFSGRSLNNEDGTITYLFSAREVADISGISFEVCKKDGGNLVKLADFVS